MNKLNFTMDEVLQILKNFGIDTECGACMEIAFTSYTLNSHDCTNPVVDRNTYDDGLDAMVEGMGGECPHCGK